MKVVMVGATGRHARAVLPELVKRGATVRALVRDAGRAEVTRHNGAAETVIGDLTDPAGLRAALSGAEGVFHLNPAFAPEEAAMGMAMVEAAQAAGVRKFVFSGVIRLSISDMVNHAARQSVEEALYASPMDFTVAWRESARPAGHPGAGAAITEAVLPRARRPGLTGVVAAGCRT